MVDPVGLREVFLAVVGSPIFNFFVDLVLGSADLVWGEGFPGVGVRGINGIVLVKIIKLV